MKLLRAFSVFLLFFISVNAGYSQPFFQWNDSIKVTISSATLANPWAGGLNFIQASNIDLNGDGVEDLFVFDRTGNKIRTYINKGTAGAVDFKYDPYYETLFPQLHDWVLLKDYNNDGKEDIFTSEIGGIKVYKNTSSVSTGLQFTLEKSLLYSVYNPPSGTPVNLYVSVTEIPAFADIDNDGDLDIVATGITGDRLEYHKNMSMELYGIVDSLTFQLANHCWGYAAKNVLTNDFTLFDTCSGNVPSPELAGAVNKSADRSPAGGNELCIDLDNDGDKELIVSRTSYTNLTMLTNGGTAAAGSFTAQDNAFPSGMPVDLTIAPCAFYTDVNDDGVKDLIVSPSAPSFSENFNSVLYYKNTGTNTFPVFNYQQSNLLQDNMIEVGEGSYPVFFDYDNDGLKDLFIGNYGYYGAAGFIHEIAQFKNTGTSTVPKYDLITRDYANLSTVLAGANYNNVVPAFGDMDGDGDADMIIGGQDGKLQYFENTAATGASANFVLASANMQNSSGHIIDVGDFAAPQIFDVDGNGTNDLVIGGRNGKLSYYSHAGTTPIPVMDSVTNYFGQVKVALPGYITGYSYPCLYKQGGVTNIFVGSESGFIRHYTNIDGNLSGTFTMADSTYEGIFQGTRTAPAMADIDNDGYQDLIVGNYEGGVSFYKGVSALGVSNNSGSLIHFNFDLFPNPANNSFNIRITNEENKIYQLEIYNTMGQIISKEKISGNLITFNTTSLTPGIYICKVFETNNNSVKITGALTKRIVIQH